MIQIERTYDPAKGLLQIEDLSGYVFSAEAFAHTFIITRADNYGFEGQITARFVRADGVTVYVEGTTNGPVTAELTLPPECYAAPGRFLLVIFHVVESIAYVIYAGRGTVIAAESGQTIAASDTVDNIEQQIQTIINRLSSTISTANLVALFARNIGDVEGDLEEIKSAYRGVQAALDEQGIMALNDSPNLLKYQPEGVSTKVANGPIVVKYYTIPAETAEEAAQPITLTFDDANIHAGMVLHYVMSRVYAVCVQSMVTATITEGQAVVTIAARPEAHEATCALDLVFCVQQTVSLPYGEHARTYGPGPWLDSHSNTYPGYESDEISERFVALGADQVTDSDGTVFNSAVEFTVANAPAQGYNNADELIFNHGTDGGTATRQDGTTYTYGPSGILDLVEGETYTMTCYARITDGENARLVLGYGHNAGGYVSYPSKLANHKYIDITNTTWKRIVFSFVYHDTLKYMADGANPYEVTVNHKKRVGFGVCRRYNGTVQLCGFRLVHGGLYGSETVQTLEAKYNDIHDTTGQMAAFLASVAPTENNPTASTNYPAGALIVRNGTLYKTTTAVTTGATWAVGTNIQATTLAAELALKANA